jgi:serine/threonine-protein phosphatase 2A regulatory subunit A
MKHDDVQLRINAFKNLERIALALGVDRTRDELVPFIAGTGNQLFLSYLT